MYGDREHSANLAYLTGFDPRFEEAMLILGPSEVPAILVGNECYGMAGSAPVARCDGTASRTSACPASPAIGPVRSPRSSATRASSPGGRVGAVGWKTYGEPGRDRPARPTSWTSSGARSARPAAVENATDLLIDSADGLRVINEVEQLAAFEYAACQTSQGIRRLLAGLRPGMTEREAVRLLDWNGMPLSCHLMLTAGPRATLGLLSPSDRPIERGDRFTVAFGVWGALNCRAGFVVEDAPSCRRRSGITSTGWSGPYFEAVAEWYGALRIGQTGGALHEIIDRRLGDPFFGIFLNPGHQLHLDEWVNSPISRGSAIELRSGMVFQVDIIPATGTDYFTTNIEDGLALADASLRDAFAAAYPAAWTRIQARRRFMADGPRHRAPPGRPAVLEPAGVPAAVPAAAGPRHDAGRMTVELATRSRHATPGGPTPAPPH